MSNPPPQGIVVEKFARYFHDPEVGDAALRIGASGIACQNIGYALQYLNVPFSAPGSSTYDAELKKAVMCFQENNQHRVVDGAVGLETRNLLAHLLLTRFGPTIFLRLTSPVAHLPPAVFISYASKDSERVNEIDQWLRDHKVTVLRDIDWFFAGDTIPENIRGAIVEADKVLAVYSECSSSREWPQIERMIAEQFEADAGYSVLIYLVLDDTELPEHDLDRLAVIAKDRPLDEVGHDLLRAIRRERGRLRKTSSFSRFCNCLIRRCS